MNAPGGRLYGLGVGPGDPELLTLKALRILRAVPVVAYAAPQGGSSFARSIVADWLDRGQDELVIDVPMDPDPAIAVPAYDQGASEIARQLEQGRDVALLCQGDPFFYGSFMYVFERLAGRYPVEVVPGVTSLTASAARLQQPLVGLDEILSVLPATLPAVELRRRLVDTDAAAIIKLGRHLSKVRDVLDGLGLLAEARYIERATLPNERRLSLADAVPETAPYFSMILVRRQTTLPARSTP